MSEMAPCAATMRLSVSMKGRSSSLATLLPIRVFPAPGAPISTRAGCPSATIADDLGAQFGGNGGEVGIEIALGLAQRVSAKLFENRVREHEGNHRLGDNSRRRHCAHVRPLVVCFGSRSG